MLALQHLKLKTIVINQHQEILRLNLRNFKK